MAREAELDLAVTTSLTPVDLATVCGFLASQEAELFGDL